MGGIYAFDDFELDTDKLELTRAGRPSHANSLTLRLLRVLVEGDGQIVTKRELLDRVWDGRPVSQNVVTVAMTRLRRALGYSQGMRDLVVNVHGRGYRFTRDVRRLDVLPTAAAPQAVTPLMATPFVGRDGVIALLRTALAEARSGRGSVVLLTGEAGIGKTRAAEVFGSEALGFGLPVAWGYCREVGDTPPLWPFANLLRELIAQAAIDVTDPQFASLAPELALLLPELTSLGQMPATSPEAPEPAAESGNVGSKHRIFDAIARTLNLSSQRMPCVLVLDDLHRGDPASLELLQYFIDEIPRTRVLVVATLRSLAKVPEALRRVLGHRNATRISLPPLNEPQVGSYLEAVIGAAAPELRRAVFKNSEGNPFFMAELARQFRMSEARDPHAIALPEVALDVVRQRIMALDERARRTLSHAAVIGRNFSLSVLQAVTGGDAATLMSNLDVALANEIVFPRRDSCVEFAFGHELLRAVLYDLLDPAERRSHHLRTVEALEARAKQGEEVLPADLAYHSRAALPLGDLKKTIRYCVEAAIAAARVFAYGDAARSLSQALETLDLIEKPSPKIRIQLLLHLALVTRAQSTRAFRPLIARVVQLAREHGEGNTLARAAMLHDPYPGFPALPGSLDAFADALQLLEAEPGEPTMRATLLARLAASPPAAFDAAESDVLLERSYAIATSSDEMLDYFSVRAGELYLRGGPAHRERATVVLGELRTLCRNHPVMLSLPPTMLELHVALAAMQSGDLQGALAPLERAIVRCRDLDSELLWHFERFSALAHWSGGDSERASGLLAALHERARQQAISGTETFCAYDRALLFGVTGVAASGLLAEFAPADNDRPNMWAMKLRGLQAAGASALARSALHLVPASRLAALPCDRDYLGTLGALARVSIALHEPEYSAALYKLLAPYSDCFAVNVSFVCEGSVAQLSGALARSLGWHGKADAHLAAAAKLQSEVGVTKSLEEPAAELERGLFAG